MFIEPGIQVNAVVHAAPAEPDAGHIELSQQRQPDAEIQRGLLLGEAAHGGQRQVGLVHHSPCLAR